MFRTILKVLVYVSVRKSGDPQKKLYLVWASPTNANASEMNMLLLRVLMLVLAAGASRSAAAENDRAGHSAGSGGQVAAAVSSSSVSGELALLGQVYLSHTHTHRRK